MEITLDLLLASRDRRVAMQQKLRETYPNLTLVCLTVIMPGNVKRNLSSLITAHAATSPEELMCSKISASAAGISLRAPCRKACSIQLRRSS